MAAKINRGDCGVFERNETLGKRAPQGARASEPMHKADVARTVAVRLRSQLHLPIFSPFTSIRCTSFSATTLDIMNAVARIITLAIAAIAGVVYGVVGPVAPASMRAPIPVGIILAIVGAGALILAIRLLADRWAALAAGAGMTVAVLLFSGEGPGGSVIVPGDSATSFVWALVCPLVAALIVAWPQLELFFDREPAGAAPSDRT